MSTATETSNAALLQKSLHVLYAEDVRELRDVTKLSLTRDGHTVECAADGEEALEMLTANPDGYDVLITDHHMPRMDGLELVTEVRTLPFRGKIIVFSSWLSPEVEAAYHQLNVEQIVSKPVYPSVVRELLHHF